MRLELHTKPMFTIEKWTCLLSLDTELKVTSMLLKSLRKVKKSHKNPRDLPTHLCKLTKMLILEAVMRSL